MCADQQTDQLTLVGSPVGGTFRLKVKGFSSEPLPHNATPEQIEAALADLRQRIQQIDR